MQTMLALGASGILLAVGADLCSTDPGSLGNAWAVSVSSYCEASGLGDLRSASPGAVLKLVTIFLPALIMAVASVAAVAMDRKRLLDWGAAAAALAAIGVLAFLFLFANVEFEGGAAG